MTHQELLKVANDAVLANRKKLNKEFYPLYHIAPYAGWLSAPSGLVYFRGLYHLFYQHNPHSAQWGLMHWGHLTSDDLIHWRHHPIALAPGDDWDRDGCFAGSSIVHDDKLYLFYTGHHWIGDTMYDKQIYQVQCLAVSEDGFTFEKKGIVVKPPAEFSHFRDPKVWKHDGRWWMVCGGFDNKDQTHLLLYNTDDLEDWDDSVFTILGKADDKNITMWECPDLFPISNTYMLVLSPQGMEAMGYDFRNHCQAGFYIGDWKPDEPFASTSKFLELDYGHDFHAPQTLTTVDGRRIMIGWLGMWNGNTSTTSHNWSGMLSIPRELSIDSTTGTLLMKPIKELEKCRQSHYYLESKVIPSNSTICLIDNCSSCEVKAMWNARLIKAEKYGLWLGSGVELYVDSQTNRVVLNRHYPQHVISGYRSCNLPISANLELHIFFDRSSIEVFINGGQSVLSSRIYPKSDDHALVGFSINGDAELKRFDMWAIESTIMQ